MPAQPRAGVGGMWRAMGGVVGFAGGVLPRFRGGDLRDIECDRDLSAVIRIAATAGRTPVLAFRLETEGEMPENKTKATTLSVNAYVEALPDPTRRTEAKELIQLMQRASGEKPKLWGPSIIGFGSYHYKYDSGREGDMPLISFSPRKAAIVLYSLLAHSEAQALLAKLGKHTTGKGC